MRAGRSSASTRPFRGSASGATSGGSQLSGGEQQMLAIAPRAARQSALLVMDEPTEGLAPIIVEQVEAMLVQLAEDGDMAVLLIEQNIGVATAVSDHVAIMVNGRINRVMDDRRARRRPRAAAAAARRWQAGRRGRALPEETAAGERPKRAGAKSIASNAARPPQAAAPSATSTGRALHLPSAGTCRRRACGNRSSRRRSREPDGATDLCHPVRRAHRPHRACRRHLRHQGHGAAISSATGSRRSAFRPARSISRPRASRRAPT